MSLNLKARRWHPSVAPQSHIEILANPDTGKVIAKPFSTTTENDSGLFGIYDGQLFAVGLGGKSGTDVAIYCSDQLVVLPSSANVQHSISAWRRKLDVYSNGIELQMTYRRISWTVVHSPTEVMDLIFDDWWGLECDLPGWFAGVWSSGGARGAAEAIRKYLAPDVS